MSLHDHLRTDQNICLLVCKSRQDVFIAVFRAGSVIVHPQHPRLRETLFYNLLDFLCAGAEGTDIL